MYSLALAGAAIACYFLYAALRQPRPAVILVTILWMLYAAFELAVAKGALGDPTALPSLGIDLFLWPILLIATLFASYAPGQWTATAKRLAVTGLVILGVLSATLGVLYLDDWANGRLKRGSSQSDVTPK